jgi:hypothetical protein
MATQFWHHQQIQITGYFAATPAFGADDIFVANHFHSSISCAFDWNHRMFEKLCFQFLTSIFTLCLESV